MTRPFATPSGPVAKLLAFVGGAALLLVGLMFSVVALAIVLVAGLGAWAYLWWNTRGLRHALRERPSSGGQVIEGEVIIVEDGPVARRDLLPPVDHEK